MRKTELKKLVTAFAIIATTFAASNISAFAQTAPTLDCKIVPETDETQADFLNKFRKSYLEQRSVIEMSNLVNFYDIQVSDCDAVIIISLTPKTIHDGENEAWIFQKDPWRLIGSN